MLLEVEGLRTVYRSARGTVTAVDGVSLAIDRGENLGLVGESGCGKTTLAASMLRVLGPAGRIVGGRVLLEGRDITSLSEKEMDSVRWRSLSLITQSAMNALDPVYRVGDQVVETLRAHAGLSRPAARTRVQELFASVGLERNHLSSYPHQLSGGMRQRAVIAMALALEPSLVIADEPTTALDVVVQAGIIAELERLRKRIGSSMMLVTHDISLVGQTCDRIAVMYAGELVEIGSSRDVMERPAHPYTMGLLNAYPTVERAKDTLVSIPGSPPDLSRSIRGCRFAPRCPFSTERCHEERPTLRQVESGHQAACHYVEKAVELRASSRDPATWSKDQSLAADREPGQARIQSQAPMPIIELRDVRRLFPRKRGLGAVVRREPRAQVHAVDGLSLAVRPGEIVGLAGESGSGKSTLAEIIAGLQPPSAGTATFRGQAIPQDRDREFRSSVQMVFQDPYETLNPRFTVLQTMSEPLRNLGIGDVNSRRGIIEDALRRSGLDPSMDFVSRYPHELSGGQRQRVAIARAIVVEPEVLIADEPTSMLDVSIRAGILNLFRRFRDEMDMSIVYVSHDLATIRYICDRTAVMYLGRIVEIGPTADVIDHPRHPYSRLLLASVPEPGKEIGAAYGTERHIPDAVNLPNGCRFHGRCPYAMEHCGWEGRDLARLLSERSFRLISESPDPLPSVPVAREREIHEAITRIQISGVDLVVSTQPGREEEVADYLDAVARAEQPSMAEAVQELIIEDERIISRYAEMDDPPFFKPGKEHEVACLLFENDSDVPESEPIRFPTTLPERG